MKALVVDDDHVLADVVAFTLRREGFEVVRAFDGRAALQVWDQDRPDLIILDVNLPHMDGFAVCQAIRRQSDTPILLLTVRDSEDDIVRGLELGADDYITKPFSPRQLVARAHCVLRRAGKPPTASMRQAGRLVLDPTQRQMHLDQGPLVSLTPLECQLLEYLILNAGQILTNEIIIDQIWGPRGGDRDMLRQLIHRLREKMSAAAEVDAELQSPGEDTPPFIKTVPGLGYGLITDPDS